MKPRWVVSGASAANSVTGSKPAILISLDLLGPVMADPSVRTIASESGGEADAAGSADDVDILGDGLPSAGMDGFRHQGAVGKILVGGVDRCRHGQPFEEAEQRPQLMLDDQRVTLAAAGRRQNDRL